MHTPTHLIPDRSPRVIFPWMTVLLIGSVLFVFLWQLLSAAWSGTDVVGDELSFSRGKWLGYEGWTVVTYAWVHSLTFGGHFWLHVTFNMIGLICFGPILESVLGPISFLFLYVGGAVFSALFWMWLTPLGVVDTQLLGASGAVFAVLAGAGIAKPGARVVIFLFGFLPMWQSAGRIALIYVIFEFLSLPFQSGVAHLGHLGGALFGFVYVLLLKPRSLDTI